MCSATVPLETTVMAREFDETVHRGDAWIADKKGKIRARFRSRKMKLQELADLTGLTKETVFKVLWEDNIRHTVNTIVTLLEAMDIRVASIDGVNSKPQPDELPPLSPKVRAALNLWVKQHREQHAKKKKPKST